jgi:glutamyl-tRNA reductase
VYIANRTVAVAEALSRQLGGTPATLDDVPRAVQHVDLVISATGARAHVLTTEAFAGWTGTLHVFDLAIPRDVEAAVGDLPGVTLHDLDTLLPSGEASHWEEDIRTMESVIAGEVHEFMAWAMTRRVVPVIASLRSHVEAVSQQELKRVAPQLAGLTERERRAVESLTDRLIDKMFHHLVTRLRLAAQTDPSLVEAAEFFFLHGEGGLFPHAAEGEERSEQETERR